MYNANKPMPGDLPSAARLFRSTILAAVAAAAILLTIVLPAEYGVDPTRLGRVLGLTEMGEIKTQLAAEAEADRQMQAAQADAAPPPEAPALETSEIEGSISFGTAPAASEAPEPTQAWTDRVQFTLSPGEGIEFKLVMDEGAVAEFSWSADGGVVNYDLHGDGSGNSVTYKRGRGVPGDEGVVTAEFAGNHGWFWRNRDGQDVTVTLRVRGAYRELKQTS